MGKSVNIFITFFSAMRTDGKAEVVKPAPYDYQVSDEWEAGYVTGSFTNEAPLYSIAKMLGERGEQIDYIYGFSTNDERKPHFEVQVFGEAEKRPPYEDQVEFFQKFMKERCKGLAKTEFRFIDFVYPTADLDRECADQAIRAAAKIKNDMKAQGFAWSDCRLYVDVTGGIRAADMVLSQIIQLLQHDGMQVERILYSDYQREAAIPNRLFNLTSFTSLSRLISGADAFVRYGSSLTLEEYFDYDYESDAGRSTELSEPLRKLLHAMHRYSDVMQICQVNEIKNVLVDLKRALDEFSQHTIVEESLKERAFSLMLDTIQSAYEDILRYAEGEEAALYYEMIRWCLKNGFTQQAMTLYVEWMPVYLEEKRVFYPAWREVMEKKLADGQNPSWQKTVLDFCSKESYALARQTYCLKKFRKAIGRMTNPKDGDPLGDLAREAFPEFFAKGREELEFLLENREIIEKMRDEEDKEQYIGKFPRLKALYEMIQEYPKEQERTQDFAVLLQETAGWGRTCEALKNMAAEGQCRFHGLGELLSKDDFPEKSDTPEERAAEFEVLLDEGILRTEYKREDVLALVADYRKIRRMRNRINHAGNIKKKESSADRREMDRWIRDCLERIRNMKPVETMESGEQR